MMPCSGAGVYSDAQLVASIPAAQERFVAANTFDLIRTMQGLKDSTEARFTAIAKHLPVIKKLATIPGISTIRASIIAALVCSPERFTNKHKFWAYAMLVNHLKESDGVIYGVSRIKGRTELKTVFMGAATAVMMSNNALRREYDRSRSSGISHRDARKAVARRIAAIALMIMKTGRIYDDRWNEGGRGASAKKT
jgi:transposase